MKKITVVWLDGETKVFTCRDIRLYGKDDNILMIEFGDGTTTIVPLYNVRTVAVE